MIEQHFLEAKPLGHRDAPIIYRSYCDADTIET